MIPFLTVLLCALFCFTFSYIALNEGMDGEEGFIESLKHNYLLMYGDFDTENYNGQLWVYFVVASTMMPLILLNMLIAIMSDTYARVMGEIVPSDYQ